MTPTYGTRSGILFLIFIFLFQTAVFAESCERLVRSLNGRISPGINEQELVEVLRSLNNSNHSSLPAHFVTKQKARSLGWKPGRDLWSISALKGVSIGGDRFRNHEHRLPEKIWREADLDYQGGRRGGKRILYASDGDRRLTLDHYQTFLDVPACR